MNIKQYFGKSEQILQCIFSAVRNNTAAFILFLVIVNLIIKSYNLYENSLHTDEVYRITWGQRTYTDILKMSKSEVNPPFYLWVLHTWIKLNGNYTNEVHSRYLSLIFSVLSSVVIFLFAKSYLNYSTGVIASLFFSLNPIQVVYAHNISAYSMITFLMVCSLYITHLFFLYFHQVKIRWLWFALLIIIDTVLLYTHYLVVFGLITQFIMAIFECNKNKKALIKYIMTQISVLVLFLPWLGFMLKNSQADPWMKAATWTDIKNMYIHFLGSQWVFYLYIPVCIILLAWHLFKKMADIKKITVLFLLTILPVLGVSLISILYQPFFVDRYMLYLIPGALCLLGYAVALLKNIWLKMGITGFFAYLFMLNLNLNPIVDTQVRQLMPAIAEEVKEPGTLLVISVDYMKYTYAYYYNQYNTYIQDSANVIKDIKRMNGLFISKPEDVEKIYSMPQYRKIVYVQLHSEIIDPHHKVSSWLKSNFKLEKKIAAKAVGMSVYRSYDILWTDDYHTTLFTSFEDSRKYQNITAVNKKNGNFSAFSNHKNIKFSEGIQGKIGKLHGRKGKIKVSAWIYLEQNTKANFVLSFHDSQGTQYIWQNANIDYSRYGQWQYVTMEVPIPETKSENDYLKCYLNAYEGGTAYLDDLEVQAVFTP